MAEITTATFDDLEALLALERVSFSPALAYDADTYAEVLTAEGAVNLKAVEDARIVGFAGAFADPWRRIGHIYTIHVHPEARRHGLGRRLLDAAHDRLRRAGVRRVFLEVAVDNAPARRMYEEAGYRWIRRLHGYYEGVDPPDADQYGIDLTAATSYSRK